MKEEHLLLKWGTIKGWNLQENQKAIDIFNKMSLSYSAMAQERNEEHKKLMCELIDSVNGEIQNDWTGEVYENKEDAKNYILNYDKK